MASLIIVKTQTLPAASAGVPYEAGLAITGQATAVTAVSVASGALPPGLVVDTTLRVTGTPTASGKYTFTLSLTETAGSVTSGSLTISVGWPAIADVLAQSPTAQNAKTWGR